ncbi:MAG: UDP-N-acetylmuramoyl-L-alanyl-D-glutamate--2,6-diaminopimelate ligase [Atopobiaceae bacterium]|jgi:UDP-N-acetylmuramoyl-L-alanyl-D-glutamate--2,6-diaminopimelate ligase|nr:UDP-N-acetylmuramoyl-L-alanyl-D-glutamate--2,6-diaminopimelate ligase [Atopobiaceae bacterium]MCI2173881.1 UDP-N-acetylmuramoyl-L-alanyl-D-glutamate--2,6-diaminopimelate ligase [Atopobiaceae bacterium]MCI2208029.1 UDP-N-acetylmuramoyl-L-alanyl-D-glutamate--2,6-diaminopimelate ligase [Atopobiaceae bacterium]
MTTTLASLTDLLTRQGMLDRGTDAATPVTGVSFDSRQVSPGDLFVCKGAAFRAGFLAIAMEAGAVGYLCDETHADALAAAQPDVPALVAPDDQLRPAMAVAAAEAYDHPDHDLHVVGITGTKGKSTVAYMLRAILDAGEPYSRCAIMGSIDTFDGVERFESTNTTPEAPEVFRHLANARDAGLGYMVMEVSSQGLKYDRVRGVDLGIGVFLNIGRDHISAVEHPTFEDYFASKLRIFEQSRVAVVNLATDHVEEVLNAAERCERVVCFSAGGPAAVCGRTPDVWAENVTPSCGFVSFDAHTPSWEGHVILGMGGLFNVENALAAIACCEVLGVGHEQIVDALNVVKVPGRMELVESGDGRIVAIVDYAHNVLSFERLFDSLAAEYPGREVIAVFGAPGGKAQERRRQLPETAARFCDHIIYTEEDPAHEDAAAICAEMLSNTPAGVEAEAVPDRAEAVRRAVDVARSSGRDCVVALLAKGDERLMHRGDAFEPCETDAELVLKALRAAE